MSFGQPLFLLSLLAIPLAVAFHFVARRRRMRYAVRFTNLDVLASVVGGRRSWRRYAAPLVFLLSIGALGIALARPNVSKLVPEGQATVILVIDVSGSMQATDVKPTRLKAAEHAARTFLDHAPSKLRVGLIAFAGEPQVATPPTTDHKLVAQSLDTLDLFQPYGGTAIGDALAAAVELGRASVGEAGPASTGQTIAFHPHGPQSPVSILFLSDGSQTRGLLQPLDGASRAKAAGIPVYTVALGTPNGTLSVNFPPFGGNGYGGGGQFGAPRTIPVPPDPATLRAIANTTGGRFFEARSAKALESAYARLGSRLGRHPGRSEVTSDFVLAAAGLLIAAGLLSAFWSPRLP
jgi:Ca-activated chloride channel family protein